jgi:DNA-binding CsgD family transcriptional regulator
MQEVSPRLARIVAREPQIATLRTLIGSTHASDAVVLTGGPGIGKTTLWEAGIDIARACGTRVLVGRPGPAEAQAAFAGLIDLCDGIDLDVLGGLPAPQRSALEVALLRAEPTRGAPSAHTIGLATLGVLRALRDAEPILIAIDDVQWLDRQSAAAVAMAARRLEPGSVTFLLARRPGPLSAVEDVLGRRGLDRIEVGPLGLRAIQRLLSDRLDLAVPRRLLRQIVDSTLGNPLFALELGRTLVERGVPDIGDELVVPETVEEMLGTRVGDLPALVRRALLAVALAGDLSLAQLESVVDPEAVEAGVESELLQLDGRRVRPSHPLLAAAAKKRSRARERRDLHLALSRVVVDPAARAEHQALATHRPNEHVAATVAAVAAEAEARGARDQAVRLAEHALRLTSVDSSARIDRLMALAGYLHMAGELGRITELLTPELASMPSGPPRARAWLHLSEGTGVRTWGDFERHLDAAFAEAAHDPYVRAYVLARKAGHAAGSGLTDLANAETLAEQALDAARAVGPDLERLALNQLCWARAMRGQPVDELCRRYQAVSHAAYFVSESPERVAGKRLIWRGELRQARSLLTGLLALADEQGEPVSYALQRLQLCELELRGGNWDAAERLLDEWAQSSERAFLIFPTYERCRALHAAGRGWVEEAERWAAEVVARSEGTGVLPDRLEALRARGIAGLMRHDLGSALESLRPVWEHAQREGIDEPGAFPVAPDLVEALVGSGATAEASAVTERIRELARRQRHPWGLATAKRCEAVIRLTADDHVHAAAEALEEAAAELERLELRFDHARSLLFLGRAQRRRKKWGAARRALEGAVAAFAETRSPGWLEEANAELARVGARRATPRDELTPAEQHAAQLAATGLSNKEIAAALHVTVHTVEVHLSRVYRKLGVRSRRHLAGRLERRE